MNEKQANRNLFVSQLGVACRLGCVYVRIYSDEKRAVRPETASTGISRHFRTACTIESS